MWAQAIRVAEKTAVTAVRPSRSAQLAATKADAAFSTHARIATKSRIFEQTRTLSPYAQQLRRNTTFSSSPLKACPSCGERQPLESLSCPSCSTLQPLPSHIDYYRALDLDLSTVPRGGWDVDASALKRIWRLRMAVTHPDRMSGRSEKEQQIGAQQSALINRAYETLLNPLLRAQYLLQRYEANPVSESDSLEDAELLMKVMELRERLEEAQNEQEAEQVRSDNQAFLDGACDVLAQAFGSTPPDLETAHKAAIELRYWTNIDKAAREWSPGKRVEMQH